MKHWFSHHQLKKQLKASRWALDPRYKARTKEALFQKALADHERFHVSVLKLNFKNMKRYSFAYFTFLILIGIGFYNFFPSGNLSAQQLIANATSNYEQSETSDGSIYYEKRETTDYGYPNEPYSTENPYVTVEEVWSNNIGDLLQMENRNGETVGTMIKLNEFGVPIEYESPALEEIPEDQKEFADSIKQGAIYCANIQVENNERTEALLQVSKENPNHWFINSGTGEKDKSGYGMIETHGGNSVKTLLTKILLEMNEDNDISETNHYTLEERNEEGLMKYVLTEKNSDDEHTDYIFDAQSFAIERQEYFVNDLLYSKTVYLEYATFEASERDSIFDPIKRGLTESQNFTTLVPGYIEESGCYDNHKKLSEEETAAFLASLPTEAREGYEETIQSTIENTPYPDVENSLLIPDAQFIRPTEGAITQGFKEGHLGIDIANRNMPDILASADGTVISTATGYNEGYGNAVIIDHGNGFQTHYSHLSEFSVKEGDTVTQGQVIGVMGNTGRVYGTTGICLHFELIYNGEKVKPQNYISF